MVEMARTKREVSLDDFSALECPHPYGVLPGGNRFFTPESIATATQTTTTTKKCQDLILTDEMWQEILSFLDGKSLASLVQSSRYLYVAGHQPELWRDLVLRECDKNNLVLSKVGPSWKDTFMLLSTSSSSSTSFHKPMNIPGIYSDTLYRSHLCRSFAIPSAWLENFSNSSCNQQQKINEFEEKKEIEKDQEHDSNNIGSSNSNNNVDNDDFNYDNFEIPRVSVEKMSPEDFFKKYEERNLPVIIEGAAKSKALQNWHNPEYMLQHESSSSSSSSSSSFRTTSGAAPLPANFTLPAYQDFCQKFATHEESPLYLFDRNALDETKQKQWCDDFFPEFYQNCPYWNPNNSTNNDDNDEDRKSNSPQSYGHDLFQYLGRCERPDHTWLIMGPKRSGSVFHIDPNATHAWNACITGRKRWILYPPAAANTTTASNASTIPSTSSTSSKTTTNIDGPPPGVFPSSDGDEVALPLSVGEWIVQYWKEHVQRKKQQKRRCRLQRYQQQQQQKQNGNNLLQNNHEHNNNNNNNNNDNHHHHHILECTVEPGDVMFVPHGWWHMVINLDDGINCAITHNYVSPSNLNNVLQFLKLKEDQISGCRDRNESIKPNQLYNEFINVLTKYEPLHLKNALQQIKLHGWTCQTWNNDTTTTTTNNNNENTTTTTTTTMTIKRPRQEESELEQQQRLEKKQQREEKDNEDKTKKDKTCSRSVMAKTEKVASFSFSFL